MNDGPEEWDRKMRALRRMMQLYSMSGRRAASGGVAAPASNPIQDENFIAITTEGYEEITV